MKIEVSIHNWKRLSNKEVMIEAATVLMDLAQRDEFEQESVATKSPVWHAESYKDNGLEFSIKLKND